ncbi:protein phosphatase 1 regulatory subunit 36-like [Amphibalanus amphitrite]|uniref:protein phosphatase 1 regulatory subunit 36-like n=1 Tax=Amphibalanus amphitrite TaxID=1232801 RepID=UPI001C9030F5|nr:protein phosphatase 1 regulatory subunit 36-like [Amphibalanus amphitrite]
MQPELPAHSRWLWNAKNGDLFWQTDDDNPVELFYQTSLGEEAIKKQIGLFGKRYKQYPNPATMAVPEPGRHLFARAVSKVVDRDGHTIEGKVEIDDVKAVAEAAVGQFFPTAFGRRRFSEMPNVNHFLLSIIEYFHHYFKERKLSEMAQQHNCLVYDEAGVAERRVRMKDCLLEASRCYAIFILGRGMPFHHTNEGAFGTISASSVDRQFWEALYAFTIQVVWITFGRPNCTVMLREMGRIFRTLYLDPARREAERSTGKYQNAARRRDALLSQMPNKLSARDHPKGKHRSKADELASHNYIAMCVAMARVYGVYDCPPMPPKPIYSLLKNRSAFVDALLAEDPHRHPNTTHVVERTSIGILGHPRSEFDDNLDPIDLKREDKFRQLKFLGPITERADKTRIASVTPYLLLPTLPSASDLEKYT